MACHKAIGHTLRTNLMTFDREVCIGFMVNFGPHPCGTKRAILNMKEYHIVCIYEDVPFGFHSGSRPFPAFREWFSAIQSPFFRRSWDATSFRSHSGRAEGIGDLGEKSCTPNG